MGLCTEWFVLAAASHVLYHLVVGGVASVKSQTPSQEAGNLADEFLADVAFTAFAGNGNKNTLQYLEKGAWDMHVALLFVLLEPRSMPHRFYQNACMTNVYSPMTGWPPVVDMISPMSSLLHPVLRYLSTMLAEPCYCRRLVLVYARRGCYDVESWYNVFPQDVAMLQKAVLFLISSLEKRQRRYQEDHYGLLVAPDLRRTLDDMRRLVSGVLRRTACCLQFLEGSRRRHSHSPVLCSLAAHSTTG